MSNSTIKTSHPYLRLRHLWLSLLMLLVGTNSTLAQVAKVGTTEYATIEEAVEAWGPGKTLTLLSNVTTTSTVTVEVNATKSTQNWTLDLGDYTWTANGCNAFQLYAAGGTVMNQNYGLKIYANQNGGITASGKYCIECKYDNSTAGYRPRLEIHGGTYSGSNIIYYYSSSWSNSNISNGPSTHIFKSNDGTEPVFNGNFGLYKCPLTIYAGYFNGTSFNTYPVSSTANTNLNGGHFKTISAFPSASNNKGIIFGNYKVFVKSDASIDVVNGAPATYEAKATKTLLLSANQSVNYSDYVYYEKADDAIKKYSSGTIEIILSENVTATEAKSFRSGTLTIDTSAEGSDYTGNITLTGTSAKFIIKYPEGKGHYGVTASTGQLHVTESVADGIVTRTYSVQNVSDPEAKVGDTGYSTVYDAFYAIDGTTDNKTIVLQKDVTNAGIVTNGTATGGDGKTVATFDLNGKSIGVTSVAAGNNADYTLTIIDSSQDKTGVVTNTDASLFILALTGINDYSGSYTLKIQAGTWQFDPSNVVINGVSHNMVDEGYVARDNGDGTWTVGEIVPVAKIGDVKYATLQAAVNAAQQMGGEVTVNIISDIAEETVTVKEVANFKLTIDGKKDDSSNYTVDAVIIVDGLRGNGGSTTNGASVTLQNIAFVKTTATDGIQASHYPHHLTIQDCTYKGYDNDKWFLNASVDGPLYGVTVKNVTVEHARLIYANMADDAVFQNITATTDVKVGFNVKTSGTALIENCEVTTGKYAFRDYSDAYEGTFTLKDNTFISTSTASDEGVIVNRGGAVGTAHINIESGTYTGSIKVLNNKEGVLAISGGYFSEEFPQNYIAADLVAQGKVCAPATDKPGYYTVGDPHYVAQIGDVKYVSLAAAVAAVPTGTETTIVMIDDETVKGNSGVTIATTQNVKLDLNGKTVKLSVTESKGSQLITNRGTLTITDSSDGQTGKLTNEADESLAVGSWPTNNYVTNVITNSGTLNMEAGTVVNTANGSICYAIDNNSTSYDAILNVKGGLLTAKGTAVRQFCNSTTKQNVVNVTGGVITSEGDDAIWTQLPGSSASSKKLATLNISGGELNGESYAWDDYSFGDSFEAVEYSISGGKFTGPIKSNAVENGVKPGFITGGLFSVEVKEMYCAEGYIPAANTDPETKEAYPYTVKQGQFVAQIGEVKYESLADAVAAAGTEATTIVMIADESLTENVVIGGTYGDSPRVTTAINAQNITLDLNGHKISGDKTIYLAGGSLNITGAGSVETSGSGVSPVGVRYVKSTAGLDYTSKRTLTIGENVTLKGVDYGLNIFGTNEGTVANNIEVNVNGMVDGTLFVLGNLSNAENSIVINVNGSVSSSTDVGVALNGNAKVNVAEGASVTGLSGIEARAGELNVAGGTITATASEYSYTSNASGTTIRGAAIAVSQHGTLLPTAVNVNGGTLAGTKSIAVVDAQGNNLEGVTVKAKDDLVAANTVIPEDYKWLSDGAGMSTLVPRVYVAQIGDVKYESLADAVAAVPTDGTETTITMIADETIIGNAGVTIPVGKNIVLDLNGKTVTLSVTESKGSQLITNRGTLTITDSSEGQNGKLTNVADESLAVGSWPTNNYVTNVITNSGTLNMEAGNIISTANGSICYAIDNNSTSYDAILNINGGYLTSVGTVIRQFCNSTTKQNVINMKGGVVTTNGSAAIWTQLPGSSASSKKLATLNISGGEITASSYAWYDYSYGDSFEAVEYNISGGKFTGRIFSYALRDGIISGFISGGLFSPAPSSSYIKPAGYMFVPSEEVEGYYVLGLAEVDYSWTESGKEYHDYLAFNTPFKNNYLMDGETITLLQDITLTEDLTWNTEGDATFTLNLGEFKITKGNFSIKLVPGQRVNTDKTTSISIFTSAEEGYVVKSTKDENGRYYYTVEEAEVLYTATNGTVKHMLYSSTMVSSDGTYKLLKDVSTTARLAPGIMATNVTLDLNGHTLTSTATDCTILLSRAGTSSKPKTFNLIDSSDEKGGMLKVNPDVNNGIQVSGKYNQVTIGEGVTIDGDCVALLSENQTLIVNGTINGGNDFAVATNGGTTKNATININDGAVLTSNLTAMYLPGTGTTTISGGTITGSTGVYVKSGTLNITGGEITGNGTKNDYTYNASGANSTGDALVVDNCDYPGGDPVVNVTGGTFTSTNAEAIASYGYGDKEPIGQFVHGGYFSTELDRDICEEGKKTVPSTVKEGYYELGDIVYVAQIGDVKYESLADAVAAVPTDGTETTITMIANEMIDVVGYAITIPATKKIVLDLNGYQVVGTVDQEGTSALIRNLGTLTIKDSSDTNADGTGTGKLMSGASPTWTWDGTDDYSGSYASNLIRNEKDLIVESGNLYNMSTGSAAYAIDNYSAGNVTINGGKVDAAKACAIRMFYVNGGSISVTGGVIGRYVSDDDCSYMGVQVMSGTNVDVSVSGGTISGYYALYSNASGGNTSLSGGTYDGYVGFAASVPNISITDGRYGEWVGTWGDQVKFISGGVYSETITEEYIADGYVATENLDPATMAEYPYTVAPMADQEFVLIDGETYEYARLGNIYASKVTYQRSFTDSQKGKYMPWYIPVDYTITGEEDAVFYKIDFIAAASESAVIQDENKVYIFTKKLNDGEVLKANRPYFIIPNSAGGYEFVSEDVTLYKRTEYPDSRLHLAKSTIDYDFYGTYETLQATKVHDWLVMSGGLISWNKTATTKLGSYRWYIKPTPTNTNIDYTKIRIDIAGDEDVVGISTQVVDDSEIEGYYSVNGTKLAVPVQGTNIVKYKNGLTKKIFIK